MSVGKMFFFAVLCVCCCAAQCQDVREMVRQDVKAELAADAADHSVWIFYDNDRKQNNDEVQWIAQTRRGDLTRVIERDGRQISEEQQRSSVESLLDDPRAAAKRRQASEKDVAQAESLLKLLPEAFLWTEVSHNDETTTFHFEPDPSFHAPTREARVFAAMAGEMTVDNDQQRIEEVKGTMIRDMSFGWGLVGSLKKGGWFQVVQQQVAPGMWEITEIHVHLQGRLLFFKTIAEKEDDVDTSFSREPGDVTLEQAAAALMAK